MKITLISKGNNTWYSDELENSAKKKNIEFNKISIKSLNDPVKNFGDVIFWRSSDVNKYFGKNTLLNILKNKQIINPGILSHPFVTHKFFQQKVVKEKLDIKTIPTYVFDKKKELHIYLKKGILKYPFIMKPNLGSKGESIFLIKSSADLNKFNVDDLKDYIVQNFIENDGDYRVLVLGGKPLGIIKRVARKGSFLNNISQGGTAVMEFNVDLRIKLGQAAANVGSYFDLSFCGIDFIIDKKTQEIYFLELNTTPQWQGFQKTTGIKVSEKIVDFCISMHKRKEEPTREIVKNYYEKNLHLLGEKKFHYLSRMYLWTGENKYYKKLKKERLNYLGKNINDIENRISERIKKSPHGRVGMNNYSERLKYFNKFSNLYETTSVLFFYLFSKSIYNKNLKSLVKKYIKTEKLLDFRKKLAQDPDALSILSTHAINFLYLSEMYLKDCSISCKSINPENYFKLAKKYYKKGNELTIIYLLTHCIIGASAFYSKKITKQNKIYTKMIQLIEKIIQENYFNINLDNKIEFIVCAKLMNYPSDIEKLIISEAEFSLSPIGNYIVDKFNNHVKLSQKNDFISSEHRNVLYLMAASEKNEVSPS